MKMTMCSSINAKYDEKTGTYGTLIEHTYEVLSNLKKILDRTKILGVYSKKLGLTQKRLKYIAFNCAFFHDIGKATYEFQQKLAEKSKRTDVPHSLHSAAIIHKIHNFSECGINIVAFVIATHHSKFDSQLYSDDRLLFAPKFLEEDISNFINLNYTKCANEFSLENTLSTPNPCFDLNRSVRDAILDCSEAYTYHPKNFSLLYTLLNGLLKLSDWLSSADKTFEECPVVDIEPRLIQAILGKSRHFKGWRNFQLKAKEKQGHIIIKAATGSGKTEAALLWAQNNSTNGSRIIYALPTQTTINKMYERMKPLFGDSLGIVHSAAKDYLDEKDDSAIEEYTLTKTFVKPITVTTLDSLLFSFIPIGPYTQRQINLFNATIILDELHAYDQQIIGFLLEVLRDKSFMNFKVCIMSATLPDVLIQSFANVLGLKKEGIVVDSESYLRTLYKIELKEDRIGDSKILKEVLSAYSKGKKIIVRANTIKKSIELYRQVKKLMRNNNLNTSDLLLFNSNFINSDRVAKEDMVCSVSNQNKPFIVVCTSIIQISLDIDYDLLFTELCPIDDLIQAGGRINRNNLRKDAKVVVCSNGGNYRPYQNPSFVDSTNECLLKYNGQQISLSQADIFVSEVYSELEESDLSYGKDVYARYVNRVERLNANDDKIRLRKESYLALEVVPQQLLDSKEKMHKLILRVPLYIVRKYPHLFQPIPDKYVFATKIKYSGDEGLCYLDTEQLENDIDTFDNIL